MNGKDYPLSSPQYTSKLLVEDIYLLWLINDDFNTFEFVIETLMERCRHTYEQAAQCALITHIHGKCDIMQGEYNILKPIATTMLTLGLTVKITPKEKNS